MNAPADDEQPIRDAYWQIKPGDVVVDIGAHLGEYTLPALDAGAEVFAIDPNPRNLLALNVAAGTNERLHTRQLALYDGDHYPAELQREIVGSVHHTNAPNPLSAWATLDSLELLPDHIKIDVEGGELGVICGAQQTIRRSRPRLLIEDHTRIYPWVKNTRSAERIMAWMYAFGYTAEHIYHPCPGGADRDFIIGTP